MPLKEQVIESLEAVLVPAVRRSIVGMNLVREVTTSDKRVNITLASTGLIPGAQDWIKAKTEEAVEKLPEVNDVKVEYTGAKAKDLNKIDHIIAVMSGKGGVGKSLVSSLIAVALKRKGYEVGILDADITGPSIPKMFGLNVRPGGNESGILPVLSKSGIEIMSINLLLPSEDDAVIWRGPLIGNTIKQFGEEVLWGKLDYLIVDLPPGTADAPLTLMQSFPISGVIVVFTPQDLVELIVRKAVNMVRKMEKRVLGVVENMSYLYVPEIDKRIEIFGRSRGEEMASAANAPLLGQLPIDPELARLCDEGNIERYADEMVTKMGESLIRTLPAQVK
ncbi:MAG TPA: Mrp/NBP35 family ATP-binding protein [Dehalococcoidia bacterium]|nr:Mrp/NBP35 family ATP-binding protein [Dehalococcoidia bacterium]